MIYGPIPYVAADAFATIFSFLLFIPVFAVITNFFGNDPRGMASGANKRVLKFLMSGNSVLLAGLYPGAHTGAAGA